MRLPRRSLLVAALAAALVPSTAEALPVVSKPDAQTILVRSTTPGENSYLSTAVNGSALEITEIGAGGLETGPCGEPTPGTASCSLAGITRVRFELGPGDDQLDQAAHGIRLEVFGQDGADQLHGGSGNDLLDGGPGADLVLAHAGNDRMQMEDGTADKGYTCGAGDDDVDQDALDSYGDECEVYAPEFEGPLTVASGNRFQPIGQLFVDGVMYGLAGNTPHPTTTTRWFRCESEGRCSEVPSDTNGFYSLSDADSGRTFHAEVTMANRAGTKTARTASSPPIAAPLILQMPPVDDKVILAMFATELRKSLASAAAAVGKTDLRRLARRRSIRMQLALDFVGPFLQPSSGPLKITWTVPASVARRNGYRGKSRKPVVLATGTSKRGLVATTVVDVKPTAAGRRVLRRAKRLKVEVGATLKTASNLPAVKARRSVTLKRRR